MDNMQTGIIAKQLLLMSSFIILELHIICVVCSLAPHTCYIISIEFTLGDRNTARLHNAWKKDWPSNDKQYSAVMSSLSCDWEGTTSFINCYFVCLFSLMFTIHVYRIDINCQRSLG